jgi:uncharacterized protein YkwD
MTENLYTPLLSFPFLIVVIWGILLSFLMVIFSKNHSDLPRFISIIISAVFGVLIYLLLLLLLVRFVPTQGLSQDIDRSYVYKFVTKIEFATNFKSKYLNSVLKPVVVSKKDMRALDLNFEIINPTVKTDPARELFNLVNKNRVSQGIAPLQRDEELDKLAQSYGYEIIQTRYFSHYTKDGRSPEDRAHAAMVSFDYLGENLALAPNVQTAFQSLMASQEHKENIELSIFKRTGISCIDLGNGEQLFVEEFSN